MYIYIYHLDIYYETGSRPTRIPNSTKRGLLFDLDLKEMRWMAPGLKGCMASWPQITKRTPTPLFCHQLRPPGRIEPRCHVHPGGHMRIPALEMIGESTLVKNSSVTK